MSKKNNFSVPVNQLTKSYRTKFNMDHTVKGSFNHGRLVVFDVIECLPGDTFKIDLASIIRMSTPIAPIMDNNHMHVAAYFVPNRIVYDHWEEVEGVNKGGAWLTDRSVYQVPKFELDSGAPAGPGSLADYFGVAGATGGYVNALPGRGYYMIWNEYYRSPVVSAPFPVSHSASDEIMAGNSSITINGDTISPGYELNNEPLPLAKYADYFTKCLPQPIKHDPIPFISSDLPVGIYPSINGVIDHAGLEPSNNTTLVKDKFTAVQRFYSDSNEVVHKDSLFANVDQTWNTIEALRTAFQLDKFYYKDSYARNYRDMLMAHFNVDNKDAVMQIPQKIGELRWRINVDQVLSTAGYSASSSTTVGAPGANSVTTGKGSLTTFSATEHGFIIIVGGTRHDHTYGQGLNKMWTRRDRLDYYDPVFARIGDQPVTKEEICGALASDPTAVFGYQEAWAEYRYIPDRVCGILAPWYTGSLDFWTLADNFAGEPSLNETFIYENRNSLQRALVTGASGPDYIFDFFFKVTAVREMPLYSIPGLADHF